MKKVIIMRGISCSGKSTWLNKLKGSESGYKDLVIFSVYQSSLSLWAEAHQVCFKNFLAEISEDVINDPPPIAIDNTNCQPWEMAPYILAAQAFGYEVEIVQMRTPPLLILEERNANNKKIPILTLNRMAEDLARLPLPMAWKNILYRDVQGW